MKQNLFSLILTLAWRCLLHNSLSHHIYYSSISPDFIFPFRFNRFLYSSFQCSYLATPVIYPELLRGETEALWKWKAVNHTKWSTTTYIVLRQLIMKATKKDRQRRMRKILETESLLNAGSQETHSWGMENFLASAAGDKLQGFAWFIFLEIL